MCDVDVIVLRGTCFWWGLCKSLECWVCTGEQHWGEISHSPGCEHSTINFEIHVPSQIDNSDKIGIDHPDGFTDMANHAMRKEQFDQMKQTSSQIWRKIHCDRTKEAYVSEEESSNLARQKYRKSVCKVFQTHRK